jgi:hypothetical protein
MLTSQAAWDLLVNPGGPSQVGVHEFKRNTGLLGTLQQGPSPDVSEPAQDWFISPPGDKGEGVEDAAKTSLT